MTISAIFVCLMLEAGNGESGTPEARNQAAPLDSGTVNLAKDYFIVEPSIVTSVTYGRRGGGRTTTVKVDRGAPSAVTVRRRDGRVLRSGSVTPEIQAAVAALMSIHTTRELTTEEGKLLVSELASETGRLVIRVDNDGFKEAEEWLVLPRLGSAGPVVLVRSGFYDEVDVPKAALKALENALESTK